jgi:hypothetical protein
MKKIFFILLVISLIQSAFAQPDSRNGYTVTPVGTIRFFIVFAEAVNDPNESSWGEEPNWPKGQMPLYPELVTDPVYDQSNIVGYLTKYFSQASFGNFKVIGDYYPSLVQIDYSQITGAGDGQVINYLNNLPGSDIITAHAYSINSNDFDQ